METKPTFDKKTPREAAFVPASVRERHKGLMDTSAAAGIPAMPLLGVLPLRRLIPQDLHSVLDYQGALSVLGAGLMAGPGLARLAGVSLGLKGLGVSLLTDYRLSLRKFIPIEVHEVIDYVWSLGVIAAPFLLGYSRRNRWATRVNLFVGVTTLLGSLFTDYRAQRGVQWGRGAVTDLGPVGA
ncbi:hypothetical protein [Melittangium boletus]|uniref:Uncharacterized protein n=1 Tax=Melittangium boletus DSM 14713 TaxID=1294270 RepID=A0A250IJV3_9BACT|nr:hypothetical protein [Melittangium boletus]ATB31548.1 hypothetical protein MEBOL_005011 [Melittangium boletus DSM 14713]